MGFPGSSAGKESAMQKTPVQFLGWQDPLQKDQATHTPLFLGFLGGSANKESACSVGDLGSIWS